MGFGEENHTGKMSLLSHRRKGVYCHLASVLMTIGIDLDHCADVLFVKLPTVKLLFPPLP